MKQSELIKISIIIVNYNSFDLLENCISSIISYTQEISFEIIVIDNNSNIGNIEEVINKYEDIILIKLNTSIGFGEANNKGIEIAHGKYILILNNDTRFIEDSMIKLFDFAETLNGDFFIQCRLLNNNGSYQNSAYKFPSLWRITSSNFFLEFIFSKINFFNKYYTFLEKTTKPCDVDSVLGAFIFTKKITLNKLNGFDESIFFYHEDTDLCYRLKKNGGRVIYFPLTSIIHIGSASSNSTGWFQIKNKFISRLKFFKKNYSIFYFCLVLLIELLGKILRIPYLVIMGILTYDKEKFIISYNYFKLFISIDIYTEILNKK